MHNVEEKIRNALRRSGEAFVPAQQISLPGVHERARALRTRILVSTLIMTLLIASGAFLIVHTVSNNQPGSFIGPRTESNVKIARDEVAHLLDIVNVPPGSTRIATPSRSPDSDARSQHISSERWWAISMGQRDAFEWIFHHHPAGLALRDWGAQPIWEGSWAAADTHAYVQAAVDIGIIPVTSRTSKIRAIADATWLTDRPADDVASPNEQRVRVEMSGGCPKTLPDYFDVTNPQDPALHKGLVFPGTPTAAMRCIYGGTNILLQTNRLDASAAASLAHAISQIILGSAGPSYFYSCPSGGEPDPTVAVGEIIVLHYSGKPDVDLWHATICRSVDNGFIRTSIIPPAF